MTTSLYIPLVFWFSSDPGLALPFIWTDGVGFFFPDNAEHSETIDGVPNNPNTINNLLMLGWKITHDNKTRRIFFVKGKQNYAFRYRLVSEYLKAKEQISNVKMGRGITKITNASLIKGKIL
jgi:hypothetical protein